MASNYLARRAHDLCGIVLNLDEWRAKIPEIMLFTHGNPVKSSRNITFRVIRDKRTESENYRKGFVASGPVTADCHGANTRDRQDMTFSLDNPSRDGVRDSWASVPLGERVYAIGDIHGRCDLLNSLSEKLKDDLGRGNFTNATAVFLGDYVDRGPDSAGVVTRLATRDFPLPFIALRGNHEAILLDFLADDGVLDNWRHYGGLETLVSYGVDVRDVLRGRNYKIAQEDFRRKLPRAHFEFFEQTKLSWSVGDYFFCHAGVRPNVRLAHQNKFDLLWIREKFSAFHGRFEKIIVHGHTPVAEPQVLTNRIGIDTGACATGVLTCLVLEGEGLRFITA
jgi:serine/threonine protein phosphatase 1